MVSKNCDANSNSVEDLLRVKCKTKLTMGEKKGSG